jgi:mannosyltransferase OCH1-like enzyme
MMKKVGQATMPITLMPSQQASLKKIPTTTRPTKQQHVPVSMPVSGANSQSFSPFVMKFSQENKNTAAVVTAPRTIMGPLFEERERMEPVIPLIIFQTWFSHDLPPSLAQNVDNIKIQHPDFQHVMMDDDECRAFIERHFGEDVIEAFDRLIPGAYKADLWRYCVLFVHGGIYLDIKYQCVPNFSLLTLTDKEYYVMDMAESGGGIYNALIVSKPQNTRLREAIDKIVEHTQTEFYGNNSLAPTGPMLLKFIFKSEYPTIQLRHFTPDGFHYFIIKREKNGGFTKILQFDPSYRNLQKKFTNHKQHYSTMWDNRTIYSSS